MATGSPFFDQAIQQATDQAANAKLGLTTDQLDAKKRQDMIDQVTAARNKDLATGAEMGRRTFGPGSLGRIDTKDPDIATVIAQRRAQANGFTPEEMNAQREQGANTINQGLQTNLRQLRAAQGANGIHGGAAIGQQATAQRAATSAQADNERNVFLKNIDAKRAGTNALEQSTMARDQFNIGQQNKELYGQQATQFGIAGLGAAERAGVNQTQLSQQQYQAMMAALNQ